jgi:hypothetical protein
MNKPKIILFQPAKKPAGQGGLCMFGGVYQTL